MTLLIYGSLSPQLSVCHVDFKVAVCDFLMSYKTDCTDCLWAICRHFCFCHLI